MPNREEYQADKERYRAYARKYRAANRERYREQARKDIATYRSKPENIAKERARYTANNHLVRQTCEIEGCELLGEKHHDDYNKPLEIRYLCKVHHEEIHHT